MDNDIFKRAAEKIAGGTLPFDDFFLLRVGAQSPEDESELSQITGVLLEAFSNLPEKDQRKILQTGRIAPKRGKMDVHFSSEKQDYGTPPEFFAVLDEEFHFTLDVCATPENAKCPRFITPEQDTFIYTWGREICWMNPEYGRALPKFLRKAWEESQKGATVVCLIPARTDTPYWREYVMNADEIRFVEGRIHFVGAEWSAPFPSAVVIFRPGIRKLDHVPKITRMVWKKPRKSKNGRKPHEG